LSGALQVRHQAGDEGETLWFNPVFDAGLLIHWRRTRSAWDAVSTQWLLGREIRGDDPGAHAPLPIQVVDVGSFGAAFPAVATATLERAAAPQWQVPRAAARDDTEIRARFSAAATALRAMRKAPGYEHSVEVAHALLARHDPSGPRPSDALAAALNRLGSTALSTEQPVSAFRGSEGWSLVLQSPLAPGVVCFVRFKDNSQGAAEIVGVAVVDYAHQRRST
jgi:hypothetical protein